INITNLDQFRSEARKEIPIAFQSTVPVEIGVKANNSFFEFETLSEHNFTPNVPVSSIQFELSGYSALPQITLSTGTQKISPASGIPVPDANNGELKPTAVLSSSSLQSHFAQAGSYSIPLTFNIEKPSGSYPTAT